MPLPCIGILRGYAHTGIDELFVYKQGILGSDAKEDESIARWVLKLNMEYSI